MNIEEIKTAASKLVVVMPEIRIYGGKHALQPKDLGDLVSSLPPKDLAELGTLRALSPLDIAPFKALRQRAIRLLFSAGPRFMGGYALSEDKVPKVGKELDALQEKFNEHKSTLLNDLEVRNTAWADAHASWASVIRAKQPTAEYVSDNLFFGIRAFRVTPDDVIKNNHLNEELSGLPGQLLSEMATVAHDLWEESLKGKDKVKRQVLGTIRTLRNKADGLAFLDVRVLNLVRRMDEVLGHIAQEGPLTGADLMAVTGLVLLIADTDKLREDVVASDEDDEEPPAVATSDTSQGYAMAAASV